MHGSYFDHDTQSFKTERPCGKEEKFPVETSLEPTKLADLDSLAIEPQSPPLSAFHRLLSSLPQNKKHILNLINIIASNHDNGQKTLRLIDVIVSANLDDKVIESLYHYIRIKI